MDDLALSIRQARPSDAADLARIYIESWQDTYAGILPHALLTAMSHKGQAARWQQTMRGPGAVLIAEDAHFGPVGLASLGPARDKGLGLDGEIYTLYVDPAFLGRGTGRALLAASFAALTAKKYRSCVIWAHARNMRASSMKRWAAAASVPAPRASWARKRRRSPSAGRGSR